MSTERNGVDYRRTSIRAAFGVAATTLVLGGVIVPPVVVNAAPLVTGVVINDANGDGAVNSAVGTGAEVGLAGATVDLLDGSNAVVSTDTTDAAGAYSLDAGVAGSYTLRITAPTGWVVNQPGDGGAGIITRSTAVIGTAALNIAADATLGDALLRPDFEMQLGYIAPPDAIITGAPPFDTTDPACSGAPLGTDPATGLDDFNPLPGNDCARDDDNVRSGDNTTFNYTYSGSAYDDTVASTTDVVIQQTITPVANGLGVFPVINYTRIPTACTPGNGGGTPPPSSKVEYESSPGVWVEYAGAGTGYAVPADPPAASLGKRLRLTCNKGTVGTGDAGTLGITVRVDGTSPEGSTFTANAIIYAVDNSGGATALADGPLVSPTITIKARPEWDVRKSGFYRQDWTSMDPDGAGPLPTMPGFYTYFSIMIGTNRKAGNEPLAQPIVLNDKLSFFRGDGSTPVTLTLGTDYFMQDCRDFWPQSLGNFGNNVISKPSLATTPYTTSMAVQDSGTCTWNPTTGDITWSGIDFGGPFPTTTNTGQSLAAGPYMVANKWVRIFMPASTLDNLFGDAPANEAGSGYFWNRVDYQGTPLGVSGSQNYNGNPEPGDCNLGTPIVSTNITGVGATTGCNTLPQNDLLFANTRSNNVAGPTSFVFSPGTFSKYLLKPNNNDRSYVLHDDMTAAHSGDGTIQPAQYTSTWLHWITNGTSYEDPEQCDIWDNTMYLLVPLATAGVGSNSGASSSLYATASGANTTPSMLTYEFANIPITGDDPLVNGFNGATSRFDGVWTDQRTSNCDEPGTTWYTDPNSVPGGIDNVNAVRVTGPGNNDLTPLDPTMTGGSDRLLRVGLQARDTFYGGPHDGEAIPAGAVGANFGKVKASNQNGGLYTLPGYLPSPETSHTDGDRLTWTRAVLGVKKNTIEVDGMCATPCAQPVDVNGQVLAGRPIIWQLQPVLNAASSAPAPVPGLVVTDILPQFVEYDEACTIALTGGTPANDVQLNTPGPGQTTLVWNLGTLTPNQPITPLIICTQTDTLAPAPTSITNTVRFETPAIPMSKPSDIHTLTLEQSGELKLRKSVDAPLDPLNDDQVWTVSYANFSDTIAFGPMRTIEVFPWSTTAIPGGDFTPPGGPTRNPVSNFEGGLELLTAIDPKYPNGDDVPGTAYYTMDPPNTINQDWNLNTANWCTFDGFTFTLAVDGPNAGGCPTTLADVTGFMFLETGALGLVADSTRNRVNIPFTLQAGDPLAPFGPDANEPNDNYTNRFTGQVPQILKSGLPQRLDSNTVRVKVVGYSIGDWVWFDRDDNGIYDAGVDFVVPDGTTVELWADGGDGQPESGDEIFLGTDTTVGGKYLFTELPDGDVYIKIPATEFQAGGLLAGFEITAAAAGAEDENDDVSHDAILPPLAADPTVNGVISGIHTLEPPVIVSGIPVGSEPSSDNIHAILDTTTTDKFSNLTLDMALTGVGSIGDRVWFDANRDGDDDGGTEAGIPGVPVTVTWFGPDGVEGGGDDIVFPAVPTDANGYYLVENLPYGNYKVELGAIDANLDPTYDLDGIATAGVAEATLTEAQPDRLDVDFGYAADMTLGNRVWQDVDGDGIYTAGTDLPLENITVELWAEGGVAPITDVTTDADGYYQFDGLAPGRYYVRIPPAEFTSGDLIGWVAETAGYTADPNNNEDETDDHNAAAGSGGEAASGVVSGVLELSISYDPGTGVVSGDEGFGVYPNEDPADSFANLTLDLALRAPGSLEIIKEVCVELDVADCDMNDDADWVESTTVFMGDAVQWRITVTNSGGVTLSNVAVTDIVESDCDNLIGTMLVGAEVVYTCDTPALLVDTVNTASVTGQTPQDDTLTDSDPAEALVYDGSIGDTVWYDVDGDGVQDVGEPGIEGVTVTVTYLGGDGLPGGGDDRVFTAVTDADGLYLVDGLKDGNYTVATSNVDPGFSPTYDLDGTGTANTTAVTLGVAQDRTDVDFGYTVGFQLGNLVWVDRDGDGIYTDGVDDPAPGVTVNLFHGDGTPAGTTTTNADGYYLFNNLPADDYYIVIPAASLAGLDVAPGGETDPNTDEDDTDDHNGVASGADVVTGNITLSATLSGTPGGQLTGDEGVGTFEGGAPATEFANMTLDVALEYTNSLGDRVWYDIDMDGVQDPGEPGINGVTVTVVWLGEDGVAGGGDDETFTVVTSGDGDYLVDQLPPGNYTVTLSNVDPDFTPTYDLNGTGTPNTTTVTLAPGQNRTDVDFGQTVDFTLGNHVWIDYNGDGNQDLGEPSVPDGTQVELWNGTTNSLVSTTTTTGGAYSFAGLPAGDYFVVIPASQLTGILAGAVAAPGGGTDPDNDFDQLVDHNAVAGTLGSIQTGTITLSATLTGTPNAQIAGNEPITDTDTDPFTNLTLDLALLGAPSISIVKEVCNPAAGGGSCDPLAALGADGWNDISYNGSFLEDITWRITVVNTGQQTLTGVVVTDPLVTACATPAAFTPPTAFLPAASFSYTCVTNDLITGFTNTATVRGTGPTGTQVTDNDPAQVTTPNPVPGIEMEKYVIHNDYPAIENDADTAPGIYVPVGDQVTWVYDVFLPAGANVPLRNVTVSDNGGPNPTFAATYLSGDTDGDGYLDVGETWRFVAPAPLTVVAGQYTNIATAQGTPVSPANQSPIADNDPANHFGVNAAIQVVKFTNNADANTPYGPILAPGAAVTWRYNVRNTGNVPLLDVTVVDDQGVVVDCGAADGDSDGDIDFLAVGAAFQVNCTGTGTATPGQYTNIATVEGTPSDSNGNPLLDAGGNELPHPTDTDPSNYFSPQPSIDLVKTTQTLDNDTITGPFVATGQPVLWTFTVTNTGNTALRNVTVTDDQIANDATIDCDGDNVIALMVPDEVVVCTVLGTAIEGQYENMGSVTGQPVMPTVAPSDPNDPGTFPTDPAAYSPVVLTGTTTPLANVTDTNPDHYFGVNPSVSLVKYTNGEDADVPYGPFVLHPDTVTWTFEVTNDGNTALTDVTVTDDMIADDATIDCDGDNVIALMLPGDVVTCTVSGPSEAGQYANIGSVSGNPAFPDPSFNDDPGFDPDDPATWPTDPADYVGIVTTDVTGTQTPMEPVTDDNPSHYFGADPSIDLLKTTQTLDNDTIVGPFVELGQPVLWTYTVTNTGNTALSNVTVVDDMLADDSVIDCDGVDNIIAVVLPGETVICTAFGVAEEGQYANVADVNGTPTMPDQDSFDDPAFDPDDAATWPTDAAEYDPVIVDGTPLPDETDTNPDHYFGVDATIEVIKSTNTVDADDPFGPFVATGDPVEWTYDVTNTGNVALANVTLTDDMLASTDLDCGDGTNVIALLMPGETVTCTASGAAVAGQYENIADVVGEPVFPDPSYFDDPGFDPDDPATWPTDPAEYDPIATTDITGAETPMEPVIDDNPSHYYGTEPGVSVVKFTNGQDANSPKGPFIPEGSTVTWTFEVTNTGNTALLDVTVTDDQIADDAGDIDCGDGSNVIDVMLPADVVICTATAPAIEGQYTNVGTVEGDPAMPDPESPGLDPEDPETWPTDPEDYTPAETTDPDGNTTDMDPVTDDDPSNYFGAAPAIEIVKQVCNQTDQSLCDVDNDAHWVEEQVITQGTIVYWRITVTNTGNVDLAPVTVTDPLSPDCDETFAIIPVGGNERYMCSLDPVPGQLRNIATTVGNPVDDDGDEIIDPDTDEPMDDVTDDDDAFVQLPPDLSIIKSVDKDKVTVGASLTYTLTASNQGLGPAENVVAVDTLPVGMEPTSLPPSITYNAGTRQLTWTVGDLAPGASVSVSYIVKVSKIGTLVNVVVVDSETPGDDPEDNDDDTPVVVDPPTRIPETGSDIAPLLWAAAGVSLAGLAGLLAGRRRKRIAA